MKGRTTILAFLLSEALALVAVVLPVAHMRSFIERLLAPNPDVLLPMAPDEPWFILVRSLLMVAALQASFAFRDLYRWSVIVRPQLVVMRLVEGVITVLVALPLLHYVFGFADRTFELDGNLLRLQIHPFLIVACAGASFLTAYGLRMAWPRWIRGTGLSERVAIAGRGPMVDLVEEEIRRRHDPGIDFVGFLDEDGAPAGRHLLGSPGEADRLAVQHGIQRLVIDDATTLENETLLNLRLANVQIADPSSFYERLTGRISPESLSRGDLFLTSSSVSLAYRVIKRLSDILLSALGLVLATPLFVLVGLLIKLESRGPVFYSQERVGGNGEHFTISKFRSMTADAETSSGPVWASPNDERVTRVGRWLRKLRIDEIPQLWSVLRNDMSLVGPRPERPFFVDELEREIPHFARRHLVKPGVTGWAQINYSYGASLDDAFIKLQHDLYYIKHRSLALDVAILLRTVKVVVLQQGAV